MKTKINALSWFFSNMSWRRIRTASATPILANFASEAGTVSSNHNNSSVSSKFRNSFNDLDDALNLFRQMAHTRPLPKVIMFNQLLSRILKLKHYSVVVSLFQEMRIKGIPINVYTINILVDVYCRSSRVDCGFCVLGVVFKCGFEFDVVTFNTLIKGLFLDNKIVEAVGLFKKLVRENVCNQITDRILINGLCKAGHTQTALDLLIVMQEEGPKPDTIAYSTVIDSLCKDRMVDKALGLLSEMIERGIPPNIFTYNSLIQGLCNFSRWKEVTKLMNEMVLHNVYPGVYTFSILVHALCKEGKLESAETIIQIMIQRKIYPDVVTYNILLEGYCMQGRMDEARKAFGRVVESGLQPNVGTYSILINVYCKIKEMDEAREVFGQMVESGLQPTIRNYNTLINGYCKIKEMDEAMHLFYEIPQKGLHPNLVTYNTMLQGLFLVGRCSASLELFQGMLVAGHKADFYTSHVLLSGLCDNGLVEDAISVYHQLDRNGKGSLVYDTIIIDKVCKIGQLNIACDVFNDLISKGRHPDVYTYTAMISGFCREGLIDEALELLRKMEKNCLPNTETYNVILQEFVREKKCHEANLLLDEMVGKGISPNERTLFFVNDLLALKGGDETALKVMQKFAANHVK
ncbi:PREDICTED: putative pentatricopeptide repeat-containing protein At1g12700, mitochondrial [Ipomoea nil]|uniref:putative pentatricopeptide repeat-containing protein At1g12700, mitochondrial n=1 Tax=Ipomoea nil TaxID=35883 RepID=UPI000900C1B1|nr:PREDICTED: putative pentatricopeptide repeat-containing protein At1g12700, mitochondrial [Ipomoea nil]XP_019157942.1 PREDICTED: putative pentatricopeptide repeat-containing protein At1g12700, mitochondrial [Ipomoea nil]